MLNIKRIDHVTNVEIYKRTNQLPLSDKIKRRQLTWVGLILRRHIEEPVRKYPLYQPSEQLGSSKLERKATDFTTYIADIINTSTYNRAIREFRYTSFSSLSRPALKLSSVLASLMFLGNSFQRGITLLRKNVSLGVHIFAGSL